MDPFYDDDDNSDCDCDPETDVSGSTNLNYYNNLQVAGSHTDSAYPLPEMKILDTDMQCRTAAVGMGPTAIPSSGLVRYVTLNLPRGNTARNFVGNEITIKSLSYNFWFAQPATPQPVRISFVWDKQPISTAIPSYLSIFNDGTITPSPYSHTSLDNRSRFIYLKSFFFPSPLNANSNYVSGKIPINMKCVMPLILGNGPHSGGLLIVTCCLGADIPIDGRLRVRYYDN